MDFYKELLLNNNSNLYFQFYKNPNDQDNLEAVKINGNCIQFIQNPSEQLKLEAVKQDGNCIQFIQNPSEQLKLEAVKQTGFSLQYIQNPSDQLKLEAIKNYGYAIQFIENPTEEMKLEAVKQNGLVIRYFENPSEEMKLEAVKKCGYAIKIIKNSSHQMKLVSVKHNCSSIIHIINEYSDDILKEEIYNVFFNNINLNYFKYLKSDILTILIFIVQYINLYKYDIINCDYFKSIFNFFIKYFKYYKDIKNKILPLEHTQNIINMIEIYYNNKNQKEKIISLLECFKSFPSNILSTITKEYLIYYTYHNLMKL